MMQLRFALCKQRGGKRPKKYTGDTKIVALFPNPSSHTWHYVHKQSVGQDECEILESAYANITETNIKEEKPWLYIYYVCTFQWQACWCLFSDWFGWDSFYRGKKTHDKRFTLPVLAEASTPHAFVENERCATACEAGSGVCPAAEPLHQPGETETERGRREPGLGTKILTMAWVIKHEL